MSLYLNKRYTFRITRYNLRVARKKSEIRDKKSQFFFFLWREKTTELQNIKAKFLESYCENNFFLCISQLVYISEFRFPPSELQVSIFQVK